MLALDQSAPESVFIRVFQNRLVILFVQMPQRIVNASPVREGVSARRKFN